MAKDTRTALLDSAEHAVRSHGFDGFSYADLAEEIGIRKASVHHHFPTKAGLSGALMDRYHTDFARSLDDIDTHCETAGARLISLIDLYRESLKDGTLLCLCVALSASRASLAPDVIDKLSAFRKMAIHWIEGVYDQALIDKSISANGDPSSNARSALALLEGAHLAARAEENPIIFDIATGALKQSATQNT